MNCPRCHTPSNSKEDIVLCLKCDCSFENGFSYNIETTKLTNKIKEIKEHLKSTQKQISMSDKTIEGIKKYTKTKLNFRNQLVAGINKHERDLRITDISFFDKNSTEEYLKGQYDSLKDLDLALYSEEGDLKTEEFLMEELFEKETKERREIHFLEIEKNELNESFN